MNIEDLIKEAKRELHMRENVYPKWVDSGRLSATAAERQLKAQQFIVSCLMNLRDMLVEQDRETRKGLYKSIAGLYTPAPSTPAPEQGSLFNDKPKPSTHYNDE